MSGCCGPSPVITSLPPVPRVDVEGSLLCDVLPDGTTAGQALVEAVYDTSSGDRVGTRFVDPVTGADYPVQGTLQPCPPPEQCACETVLLCHVPAGGGGPVAFLRHICRTCAGTATVTDTTLDGTSAYDTSGGTVGLCGQQTSGRQVIERCGCDDADGDGIGEVRYVELWSVDTADPDDEPLLLGAWQDGDFTQPYEPVSPVDCPASGSEEVTAPIVLGQVCYDDGTSVRPAAVVRCAGCDDPAVRYVDVETGAEVTAPALVPCPADPGCASPTTPVTSVGLCLSDGTPIAVTITRDCTGATLSEGWLNLSTGAWSAGAVPAGAIACGDSRSIQVSGTFCAVDDTTGDVTALVLVEYTYDDTGAIADVRLVDAVTGTTYTPPAGVTVTTCPTGTAQPEQDAVILCHTAADGTTVTQFVRDYRRDSAGLITGFTDYLLDGAPYTPDPAGTVGVCTKPCCPDREVVCYRTPTAFGACGNVQIAGVPRPGFTSAEVVANPQNWPISDAGLATTYNGSFTGGGGPSAPVGVIDCNNFQGDTGVAIDYRLTEPRDNVTAVQLWNSFGTQVADNDGIGSATVTLYDADDNVLFTGPLVTCTYATNADYPNPCVTPVGNLDGVARMRIADLAKFPPSVGTVAPDIGWREIGLFSTYEATLTVDCGGVQVSALIEGDQPGLTYADGELTQVNGPHTLAFTVPGGGAGRIVTDNPAAFSALNFTDGTVITLTGNGTVEFAVEVASGASVKAGYVTWDPTSGEPEVRDANSGEVIADAEVVPCSAEAGTAASSVPERDFTVLCDVQTDGTVVRFVRDYVRDAAGAVTGHQDYVLDGTAAYLPSGTVGTCDPAPCQDCETLLLCDSAGEDQATIRGLAVSTGTLSNGVTWAVTGTGTTPTLPATSKVDNADGAWWGASESFPLAAVTPYTLTLDVPSVVEFSVYMDYTASAANPDDNCTQLPPGVEVVDLPTGYVYDPVTNQVCVTADQDPAGDCDNIANPTRPVAARFRTSGPVTSMTVSFLGVRRALCGSFHTFRFGAFEVTPQGQFLRHICRDCDGTVTSQTDTFLDGTTPYLVVGTAGVCQPPAEPQPCMAVPVCFQPNGRVEFISNRGTLTTPGDTTNGVDEDWKWQTDPEAPADEWWDMYRIAKNPNWTSDPSSPATGYEATAHWVGAHCDGRVQTRCNPVGANEGPGFLTVKPGLSPADPFDWYASAEFELPADADPDSIRIEVPALAADQQLVEWRLNGGDWQPVNTGFGTLYTLPATAVDGAQAGTNRITLHIQETNTSDASEGLLAHVVATYDVTSLVSWTQVICPSEGVYYLDENGDRQDAPPAAWARVPCGGSTGGGDGASCVHCETVILADSAPLSLEFTSTAVDATPYTGGAPNAAVDLATSQQAWDRIDTVFSPVAPAANGQRVFAAARLGFDGCPPCGAAGQVNVQVCADWHNNGPTDAPGGTARFKVFNGTTEIHSQAYPNPIVTGGAAVFCTLATVSLQDVIDGKITATVDLETVDAAGAQRSWEVRDLRTIVTSEITGCGQQFARTTCRDCEGNVVSVTQTTLTDGETYEPVGEVSVPLPPNPCVGGGTASGRQLLERCGCDDPNGDGSVIIRYVELWSVDPDGGGAPLLVGTYLEGDFEAPYVPVSPVDCPAGSGGGGESVNTAVRRLSGAGVLDVTSLGVLQSVTVTVLAGAAAVSTSDGTADIPAGASLTWSVATDSDSALDALSVTTDAADDVLVTATYKS